MDRRMLGTGCLGLMLFACDGSGGGDGSGTAQKALGPTVRVALFNIRELRTEKILDVGADGRGQHPQAVAAAAIIRRVAPDILVLNEIDHDYTAEDQGLDLNARRFRDSYLAHGADGLDLPYSYAAPNNTGMLSGLDLDGDGRAASENDRGSRAHGNDSWGYGTYPGEYSMAVLSRYPILADQARTFQRFLWQDLPGHHMPKEYFPEPVRRALRLSSKSHWDLPIAVAGGALHLFVSHPTPQGFDGDEDKNGRRNFDEIRLWVEYLDDGRALLDDGGTSGGYSANAPFVVIGDLNAAPRVPGWESGGPRRTSVYDGRAAIDQLLEHPQIRDSGALLTSSGAVAHAAGSSLAAGPPGFAERSTAVFGAGARIDYILPSVELEMVDGGVFWPTPDEDPETARWAEEASDHRLVWLDLRLPADSTSR